MRSHFHAASLEALLALSPLAAFAYDPLDVTKAGEVSTLDLTVKHEKRNRDIPLRVYVPAPSKAAASNVVLFSHGLGGSRENSPYLGKHWAARGYVVVCMQHAGSDEFVWKDAPVGERMKKLSAAASTKNFMDRALDVQGVLDQLEKWNKTEGHALNGKLQLSGVGMSGHSFGAVTTQAVSGQSFPMGGAQFTDKRIHSALAFSPSIPKFGDPAKAFGSVKVPWMLMTGTKDGSPIGDISPESRLKVFPALPAGSKYHSCWMARSTRLFPSVPCRATRRPEIPITTNSSSRLALRFGTRRLAAMRRRKSGWRVDAAKGLLEKGDKWEMK